MCRWISDVLMEILNAQVIGQESSGYQAAQPNISQQEQQVSETGGFYAVQQFRFMKTAWISSDSRSCI